MKFRIDPIDKYGSFDVDFFASVEYKEEGQKLFDYLIDEGFDELKDTFFIDFRDRKWEITPINRKKKKK